MPSSDTRGRGSTRSAIAAAVLVALALLAPRGEGGAQPGPRIGGERDRYARALELVASREGPWSRAAMEEGSADGWRRLGATLGANMNSGLPSMLSDGPAWSGRGANARASAGVAFRRGRFDVRIEPEAWVAQNAAFALAPTTGPFPWSDPAVPISIDLPQRHGDGTLARIDAGESSASFAWRHARLALTSRSMRFGPGTDHAIVLQPGASGIPRLELATTDGIRTVIGTFDGIVGWGRTPQTAWAPERRTGARYTSFIGGRWRPPVLDGRLEFGMIRLTHRDWEAMGARELLVPFGSVYEAAGGDYDTELDNQLASLSMSLRVPTAGLRLFVEYGKNDRSSSWRDQLAELDHNAALMLGVQRAWGDASRLWSLNLTTVNGMIGPISRFRDQAFFYEHTLVTSGHTMRGQLLGTPLLQREGGAELRLDRYDARGRLGLLVRTRALPNEKAEFVAEHLLRQEWMVMLEAMRLTSSGSITARVGGTADLGHTPNGGDAYSVHVGFAFSRH